MHRRYAGCLAAAIKLQRTSRRWLRNGKPGWRSPVPSVLIAVGLALALRIPYVGRPASADEAGFLSVARGWHAGGSSMYGQLWVDRPPLLIVFWRIADVLGGVGAGRWLGCAVVVTTVLAAGWTGWLIGGRRSAEWAAFASAALVSTPLLATYAVNGELLATPFVMLSCALTLAAVRRPPAGYRRGMLAAAAGGFGVCAVLIKQNFVDALVFAGVFVPFAAAQRVLTWRQARRVLLLGVTGAAVPCAGTLAWLLATGASIGDFWYALYGFRSDAVRVIATQSLSAPVDRLWQLIGAGLLSGAVVLTLVYAASIRRSVRHSAALSSAIAVMLCVGYCAIVLGGSFWLHYLIGLVPALALASAQLATHAPARLLVRAAVGFVIASAVTAPVFAAASGGSTVNPTEQGVTQYLRDAGDEQDTGVVAYGHANVLEESGLEPGYRYLWSLPMRVLDPELSQLVSALGGSERPTWFVAWEPLNSWDIDRGGRLSSAIEEHYREAAVVCGIRIYVRDGIDRTLPAAPAECADP